MTSYDYELSARAWFAIVLHCIMAVALTHVNVIYGALFIVYILVFFIIALLGLLVTDDKQKRKR